MGSYGVLDPHYGVLWGPMESWTQINGFLWGPGAPGGSYGGPYGVPTGDLLGVPMGYLMGVTIWVSLRGCPYG